MKMKNVILMRKHPKLFMEGRNEYMKFADVVKSGDYVPLSTSKSELKCNRKSF